MAFPRNSPSRKRSRSFLMLLVCKFHRRQSWGFVQILCQVGNALLQSWSDHGRHVTANTFKYPFQSVILTWSRLTESSRTSISRGGSVTARGSVSTFYVNKHLTTQILSSIFLQHSLGKNMYASYSTPTTSGQGLLFSLVTHRTHFHFHLRLSLGLDNRVYCKCSSEVMRASICEPVSSTTQAAELQEQNIVTPTIAAAIRRSNTRLHPLPLTPILKHCLRSIDTPRLVDDQPSCPPDPHLPANTESSDGDEFDFNVPAGASKAAYDEQAMIAGACLER